MNRRRTFITAAAITGTVLAGTTAVAANIGILNSAGSGPIGDLSASGGVEVAGATSTTVEPQVVEVFIDETVTTNPTSSPTTSTTDGSGEKGQTYRVDDAGSVTVDVVDGNLVLGDVATNAGWQWTTDQSSPTELTVTFVNGDSSYVFVASLTADGAITARVDEPITNIVRVTTPTTPAPRTTSVTSPSGSDDDDRDDDDRDDDDDDGGDDDD